MPNNSYSHSVSSHDLIGYVLPESRAKMSETVSGILSADLYQETHRKLHAFFMSTKSGTHTHFTGSPAGSGAPTGPGIAESLVKV